MEQMRTEFQEKLSASKRAHEEEVKALRKTLIDEEGGGGALYSPSWTTGVRMEGLGFPGIPHWISSSWRCYLRHHMLP